MIIRKLRFIIFVFLIYQNIISDINVRASFWKVKYIYPLQDVGLGLVGVVDAIWWLPGLTGICKEDVVEGGWPGVGECPPPTSEPPPDDPEKCPEVMLALTGTVTGIVEKPWSP